MSLTHFACRFVWYSNMRITFMLTLSNLVVYSLSSIIAHGQSTALITAQISDARTVSSHSDEGTAPDDSCSAASYTSVDIPHTTDPSLEDGSSADRNQAAFHSKRKSSIGCVAIRVHTGCCHLGAYRVLPLCTQLDVSLCMLPDGTHPVPAIVPGLRFVSHLPGTRPDIRTGV